MSAEIIKLRPGDDPDHVLECAKGHFQQVLVIGRDEDGDLGVFGSTGNAPDVLWMIEQFKFSLLAGEYAE